MKKLVNGVYVDMTEDEIKDLEKVDTERINSEEYKYGEIELLKKRLSDTDYIACKIAEGSASRDGYADELAQREKWREEIRALEEKNNKNI